MYFEEIGSQFDDWMSQYDVDRRINLIKGYLPTDIAQKSRFEIGCGTGKITAAEAPLVGSYTASDISEVLAKEVGKRFEVDWMRQGACSLDIPGDSVDLVISSECIEHTPNPRRALAEMARVMKPGGLIVVTSPNKLWYPMLWLSTVTKIRKFTGNENWLFPWEAESVLKNNGIADTRVSGCHLFPWQIPCAKCVLPTFDICGRVLYPLMINYGICGRKSH